MNLTSTRPGIGRLPRLAARGTRVTEELDGLPGVLGATEKERVGSGRGTEGQLIEGEALATSLHDARTGALAELQRADAELAELDDPVVIGDLADDDDDLVLLVLALREALDAHEGHVGLVEAAHAEALQHNLVELRTGPASQKSVELDGVN
jgi:hypothetical protein